MHIRYYYSYQKNTGYILLACVFYPFFLLIQHSVKNGGAEENLMYGPFPLLFSLLVLLISKTKTNLHDLGIRYKEPDSSSLSLTADNPLPRRVR